MGKKLIEEVREELLESEKELLEKMALLEDELEEIRAMLRPRRRTKSLTSSEAARYLEVARSEDPDATNEELKGRVTEMAKADGRSASGLSLHLARLQNGAA